MPVTVVVGGQYGGEGKGAVTAYLRQTGRFASLVKTGGPNAWHNYGLGGVMYRLRMLPSGATLGPIEVVFPPGSLIAVDTLFEEITTYEFSGNIVIDPLAGVVDATHVETQRNDLFYTFAGSSRRGTGAANAQRAMRRLKLARDEPRLAQWLGSTAQLFSDRLHRGDNVLVEGGQGFGLSNFHGDYPFSTSRDTTTGAFLSQVGVGPGFLGDVILVVKCFPTRNPEGRGTLPFEIEFAGENAGLDSILTEVGGTPASDGRTRRRVGLFDYEMLLRATFSNSPTGIALTGLDRLSVALSYPLVSRHYGSVREFKERLSAISGVPIFLEGWGPFIEDMRATQAGLSKAFGRPDGASLSAEDQSASILLDTPNPCLPNE